MRVAALFRDMSIRRKLTLIAVLATGVALIVAALVSMVSQWFLVRGELVRTTTSQATIVAANSASAMLFNDPKAAEQTLATLRVQGNIQFAGLHDRQGRVFALYLAAGQPPPHAHQLPQDAQHVFTATYLDVFQPIVFEGERVGAIHLHASLDPVYRQMAWNVALVVVAASVGLGAALILISYLHPAITDPMTRLVALMGEISRDKDYEVRAEFHGKDELGELTRGLNEMLAQIQLRDNALAQHRQHLEDEVVQRTTALMEANRRLEQELLERKHAEEEIRKQQGLTLQIIETIPLRVFWKDRDLRYLGCNTLFAKDAGLTYPAELIGKNDFDMGWRGQAELYRADDRRVIDSNNPRLSYDEPQTTPAGVTIWLRTSKVPMRNDANEAIGVLGVYEDITNYKQMELMLRESEQRFRNITELTTDWVWQVDEYGTYVYSGAKVHDLLGYDPEEVCGKTPFDFMPPEEAARVAEIFKNIVSNQIPFPFLENINLHKDGHRVILETSGVPLVSDDGVFHGYFGTERDITERKLAAQALEESELRFRTILDAAVDGILVVDAQTRSLVTANRAICDMLGYSQEELYALGVEDIHPTEALPEVRRQFERQAKDEIRMAPDLSVKRKDGTVFLADVSTSPMVLAGQPYLVGVFHDVTARREAEDEVRKLNEELEEKVRERTQQLVAAQEDLVRKEKLAVLGQVAGSVGHELRNPLGVMSNAVYFLQTVLADADDTTKEYLGIIRDEIAGAERIVSDLLDSVRTKPPQPESIGVKELIDRTLRKCNVPAGVSVKLEIPETLSPLRVDPLQIHQVFRNLIANGIDAMPDGGTLEIYANEDTQAKTIAVRVRDTGCGMTPEQLARLFQPLFTTKARGIGLGLVVVKNLTQANGGTVVVHSEPGQGSIFSITFPATGQKEDQHA